MSITASSIRETPAVAAHDLWISIPLNTGEFDVVTRTLFGRVIELCDKFGAGADPAPQLHHERRDILAIGLDAVLNLSL